MRPGNRFLLTAAAGAAVTANALSPVRRSGPASVPAFALGWAPSELPLQAGLAQLGAAAVAARGGGWKGWRGALGLAALAGSAAGLAKIHREAGEAPRLLEEALVAELGSDYRARITEGFTPAPEVPITRQELIRPRLGANRRLYRRAKNVSYGDFGVRNRLDVWSRADLPKDAKAPVLFQVHGGAWVMGMKEGQGEPLMGHLAERGWVCVTTNYRLSPKATWPDHVVDVKKALAWVKSTIAEHGGDPDFVVITGGSAGGHLCALTALTAGVADFQPGFEDVDLSVAAAVPFYGVYDFADALGHGTMRADMVPFLEDRVFKSKRSSDLERWRQASPIEHVRPDAPPFFVLHGTNDSLVPVEQARSFVDDLRKTSQQPVVYAELPGAQHAFEMFPSVRAHASAYAVERFLAVVRSEHVARNG